MNARPLYQRIASTLQAYQNCLASSNGDWGKRHENNLDYLVKKFMPNGSGIDCGTKFIWEESSPNRLVFSLSFHHMNENGYYDGWTEHKVIVTPSLTNEFDLKITGRDRNGIKEYLTETYNFALCEEIAQDANGDYFSPARKEAVEKFQEGVKNGTIV